MHVAFGLSFAPQPIIHVEKRVRRGLQPAITQGTVYEGFEIMWHADNPRIPTMIGIWDTVMRRHVGVFEHDNDNTYWRSVTATIDKAHKALVGEAELS